MDHIRRRAELLMLRVRGSGASPSWHSIPGITYKKDEHDTQDSCSVCLSNFEDGEDIRQLPICKHHFHSPCIDMWLYSHSNCPLCRAKLVVQEEEEEEEEGGSSVVQNSVTEERDLPQRSLRSTSSLV
ncbi:hypothetical protein MKW94_029260 [Papaver nudicaule]|uniref:RING-type E3 ubiquitin transferase n=1 Tax=Papaver nudicaule TaxID=74823 RepID=A0AA41UVF2_PAPNU|nr:hypothetical protein [Papaver nudicaule]